MSIRIGIVDDKKVNRDMFVRKMSAFEDLQLVFTAINGHDCLEQLSGLPLAKLPHVLFVDLEMPELDGIQTIQLAKPLYPDIRFIVLTVFDDDEKIFEAIKAGAHGYLLKDESGIALRDAITNLLEQGGAPMSAAIARKALALLSIAKIPGKTDRQESELLEGLLSEREKEVLLHTINGLDAKRIGEKLNISVLTVRKHISNIYEKLHVNSKAQVMNLAFKKRWI
jgi:DNA-binding NarL/FixJ family response regulator